MPQTYTTHFRCVHQMFQLQQRIQLQCTVSVTIKCCLDYRRAGGSSRQVSSASVQDVTTHVLDLTAFCHHTATTTPWTTLYYYYSNYINNNNNNNNNRFHARRLILTTSAWVTTCAIGSVISPCLQWVLLGLSVVPCLISYLS